MERTRPDAQRLAEGAELVVTTWMVLCRRKRMISRSERDLPVALHIFIVLGGEHMTVGKILKEARKKKGITQLQLANLLDVSTVAISQYETGKRSLKLETLQKIAAALEIPVIALLPDLAGQSNVTERAQRMNRLTLTDTFRLDGVALRGLRECRIAASVGGISEVTLVMDVETGLSGECLPSNG